MRLLIVFLSIFCLAAGAAHVSWTFPNAGGVAQTNCALNLFPLQNPRTNGSGGIVTRDRLKAYTGATGSVTISNLFFGYYRSEFEGFYNKTTNFYYFPDTSALINAADYVTNVSNLTFGVPSALAYSQAEADRRFINSNGGSGTNETFNAIGNNFLRLQIGPNNNPLNVDFKTAASQDHLRMYTTSGAAWYDFNGSGSEFAFGTATNTNDKVWKINDSASVLRGSLQANSFIGDGSQVTNLAKISNTNGIGTNITLWAVGADDAHQMATILSSVDMAGVPGLNYLFNTGTNSANFSFGDSASSRGQIFFNANHGGTPSLPNSTELQIVMPGAIAVGAGYTWGNKGHLQFGIGNSQEGTANWFYFQASQPTLSGVDTNDFSGALAFTVHGRTNNVEYSRTPGILGRAIGNGESTLTFFSDNGGQDNWQLSTVTNSRSLDLYGGGVRGRRGVDARGGFKLERQRGLVARTNTTIDIGQAVFLDFDAGNTNVSFVGTSNQWGNAYDYEPRKVILRSRGIGPVNITYPSAWCTNVSAAFLPATLPGTNLLYMTFESVGAGESNIIVTAAQTVYDNSWAWDADALGFFTRSGLLDNAAKSIINTYVLDLKAAGVWGATSGGGNMTNGFLYVLWKGLTNNLLNPNFSLTNHGTFTYDERGFKSDGTTGYYDTGCLLSAITGSDVTNCSFFFYAATNATSASLDTPMGSRDLKTTDIQLFGTPAENWKVEGFHSTTGGNDPITSFISGMSGGGDPANCMMVHTNAASIILYVGGMASYSTLTPAGAFDDARVLVGAVNNGPPLNPVRFYHAPIKVAAYFPVGLNAQQAAALFAATTKLNAAFGRVGLAP